MLKWYANLWQSKIQSLVSKAATCHRATNVSNPSLPRYPSLCYDNANWTPRRRALPEFAWTLDVGLNTGPSSPAHGQPRTVGGIIPNRNTTSPPSRVNTSQVTLHLQPPQSWLPISCQGCFLQQVMKARTCISGPHSTKHRISTTQPWLSTRKIWEHAFKSRT